MLTNKTKSLPSYPLEKIRFSGFATEVFTVFLQVAHKIGKQHYTLFKKHGLTEAQFFTLMAIYCSEKHQLTFTEMSKLLMVSRANVSGVVLRLEERKLLKRLTKQSDKRLVFAKLTREGTALIETIHPDYIAWIKIIFSKFSNSELKVLFKLLNSLSV